MDIWNILKISKTTDRAEIRRAYRSRLREVHPEDDPEGFMELREAYEKALRGEEDVPETGPEPKFQPEREKAVRAVETLYGSFFDRISPEKWQTLLDSDYFTMLDTSDDGMLIILEKLLANPVVPRSVLELLNRRYALTERADELSDRIPLSFFQYFERRLMREDQIEFGLIRGPENADYDDFVKRFLELRRAVLKGDTEKQTVLFKEFQKIDIQYPGLDEQYARHLLQKSRFREAETLSAKLARAYPFFDAFLLRADVMQLLGRRKEMYRYLDTCLTVRPADSSVILRIAKAETEEGRFTEARERLISEIRKHPYDIYIRTQLATTTKALAEKLKMDMERNPEDTSVRMELGKAYYQARMFHEAIEVFSSYHPSDEELTEYLNYMGRSHLSIHRERDAILAFETWLRVIDDLPDTPENAEKKKKRNHVLLLLGMAHLAAGNLSESQRYLELSTGEDPDDVDAWYESRIELLYRQDDYLGCIRLCREMIARKRISYTGTLFQAKCALKRGMMEEALFYASQAMEIYPYMVDPYEVMARVYILTKKYKFANEVLDRYEGIGIPSVTCAYYRALMAKEENKLTEAFRLLLEKEPLAKTPETCDMQDPEEFYILKGELLEGLRDPHKAVQAYQEAEKLNPRHERIRGLMGVLLCKMHRFPEAVEHLTRQIERRPDALYLVTRGMCFRELQETGKAAEDFTRVLGDRRTVGRTMIFIADQFREMEFYSHAEETYKRALGTRLSTGDRKKAVFGLADTLAERQRPDEARTLLMELAHGQAVSAEVKLVLAHMSIREGKMREAEVMLRSLLMYETKDRNKIYDMLAEMYLRSGNAAELEEVIRVSSRENACTVSQQLCLGSVYLWLGEWKKAENAMIIQDGKAGWSSPAAAMIMAIAASHQFASRGRVSRYLELMRVRTEQMKDPELKGIMQVRMLMLQGKMAEAGRLMPGLLEMAKPEGEYRDNNYRIFLMAGDLAFTEKDSARALMYYEKALSAFGSHRLLEKKCEELKR